MHLQKLGLKLLFLTIVLPCSVVTVLGQACPTFEINGPEALLNAGEIYTLRVDAKGSTGIDGLRYEWTTSLGQIINGQGSKTITLTTTTDVVGQAFVVSVSVSGLSKVCESKVQINYEFVKRILCNSPLDEFETATDNELKARLDNLFIRLDYSPLYFAVFEMEFLGNETYQRRTQRIDQILKILRLRKYDLERVYFVVSPNQKFKRTMFWVMPLDEIFKLPSDRGIIVSGLNIKGQLPTLLNTN